MGAHIHKRGYTMATIQVGILGLGRLGASLGLALKRYNASKGAENTFKITAYDPQAAVLADARRLGVADEYVNAPLAATRDREIVLLALSYADVPALYELAGPQMRDGAVLLDFAPLRAPSQAWAQKHLQAEAYMVGVTAIVNHQALYQSADMQSTARADLFDNGVFILTPAPNCAADALELAGDFAALLGSKAHFMDAAEYDALSAATEGLPALLSLASFRTFTQSEGWADIQRLTNPAFGALTHHLYDTHPDDLRDHLYRNRAHITRYLDELMVQLRQLRQTLVSNDRDALEAATTQEAAAYEAWLNRRSKNVWQEHSAAPSGTVMDTVMTGMFGSAIADRLKGKKK
jgi:prephenate dehydrogenase